MNTGPISFPDWKQALAETELPLGTRSLFEREIISFLRYCKIKHAPASVELIRQWLAARDPRIAVQAVMNAPSPAREALRWFYREGIKPRRESKGGAFQRAGGCVALRHENRPGPAAATTAGAEKAPESAMPTTEGK